MTAHELTQGILTFILAGKATFTILNEATQGRFTYKVVKAAKGETHFVKVLSGPDNETCYTYIGAVFGGTKFVSTRASKVSPEAPSFKAFSWLLARLVSNQPLPAGVKFFHEGRCGRCGRKLTVPESILTGFGPECAGKL